MKKLLVLALIIVSISLVSAQIYLFYDINNANKEYKERIVEQEMHEDDGIYYTKTNITYVNYDDPERYSTYDYRYGYSYRTTDSYLNRYKTKYADRIVVIEETEIKDNLEEGKERTIEKYFESLGRTIEVKCYDRCCCGP
jgi:hypothetical protein